MKSSFRLILVTLAATAALTGCTKEPTPGQTDQTPASPVTEGSRVIAVSFAPQSQTKTTLADDGLTPKFIGKEMIKVSNGTECKDCEVKVDDEGNATFTTNLEGILKAVYPATAAKMDEKTNEIVGVLVSTEQTGKFADANICMAEMTSEKDESLSFVNKTALFCITPGDGDKTKYVEVSTKNLDIANYCPTGSVYTSLKTIHVATVTADSVYVSILVPNGLTAGGLAFSDGVKVKTVTGDNATKTIAVNTFYKVTGGGWKTPQADIPGALKGVFTVSAGLDGKEGTDDDVKVHFSQGNLQATYNSSTSSYTWGFAANQYDAIGGQDEYGYGTKTGNNTIGSQTDGAVVDLFGWSTAVTTYGISAVESKDAYSGDFVDWGTAIGDTKTWRTLSNDEWVYLFNTRTMTNGKSRYSGAVKGVIIGGTSYRGIFLYPDNYNGDIVSGSMTWAQINAAGIVFLPAAGSRFGSEVTVCDEEDLHSHVGYYWTSSTNIETNAYEFYFYYDDEYKYQEVLNLSFLSGRNIGHSVRLVTNVSAAPSQPLQDGTRGTINGHDYVVINGVKWATQNLAITDSGKKSWQGVNISAVKVPGTDEDVKVGDYFQWAANEGYCGDASNPDKGLLIYTEFTSMPSFKSPEKDKLYQFSTVSDSYVGISPYYSGSTYTKYNDTDKSMRPQLEKEDDVANIILGGNWHMPTTAEFQAMKNATYWAWDENDKGYYVYTPVSGDEGGLNGKKSDGSTDITGTYSKSSALLFFPAAGYGYYKSFSCKESYGLYWSSTLYSSETDRAYDLGFNSEYVNPQGGDARCDGRSIRPVSD